MASWRNRIVGHGEEAPDQLLANPRNWRIHPKAQQKALEGVLNEVGWVQDIIVNQRTGFVIDGHARVAIAISRNEATVPVVYVDLDEREEGIILATLDPLSAMAGTDKGLLESLVGSLEVGDADLAAMLAELGGGVAEDPDHEDQVSAELPGVAALKMGAHWDSDLPWDIPPLRADMLGTIPEEGLQTWGGRDTPDDGRWWFYNWRTDSIRGLDWERTVLGFYTDDYRFESFYEKPDIETARLLNLGGRVALTPNYSMWYDQPRALHMWAMFRARWVGRYMQEAGIVVIPDLNWVDDRSFDFCLLGIPHNPPVAAVQIQTMSKADEMQRAARGLALAVDKLRPDQLLVYGSTTADSVVEESGIACRVIRVENRTAVRRRLMDTSQGKRS